MAPPVGGFLVYHVGQMLRSVLSNFGHIVLTIIFFQLGIPEWQVELRHASTHYKRMPSIHQLDEAADFALEYLKVFLHNNCPILFRAIGIGFANVRSFVRLTRNQLLKYLENC